MERGDKLVMEKGTEERGDMQKREEICRRGWRL